VQYTRVSHRESAEQQLLQLLLLYCQPQRRANQTVKAASLLRAETGATNKTGTAFSPARIE